MRAHTDAEAPIVPGFRHDAQAREMADRWAESGKASHGRTECRRTLPRPCCKARRRPLYTDNRRSASVFMAGLKNR